MSNESQPLRHWLGTYGFVALTILGIFWMMDGITTYRAPAPSGEQVAKMAKPGTSPGRVFILVLDSLRYQTAMDLDYMPNLGRLRAEGVWAEVKPSYNAVTVPCLRAAFTGFDEVSVLGFVQNFLHGDAEIDSLFRRLAATGRRTAAFSHGGFTQFGKSIDPNIVSELSVNSEGVEDAEDAGVARMLALFRERQHDVVIAHISYTDYAAHKFRVGSPNYRRDFRRADRLVAQASASIGPEDTLVVMGDHGHAEDGSHTLGQDVPTLLVYRGPAFKPGHALGKIDITAHTWLLGTLFGLPPPSDYTGGVYPEALIGSPDAPALGHGERVASAQVVPKLLWVYHALLALFAAGLIWPARAPWMHRAEARWLVWLGLPAAVTPMPWNAWIGALMALGIMGWLLRGAAGRAWGFTGLALLGALAWHGWGRVLVSVRDQLHSITHTQLAIGWLVLGGVSTLVVTPTNRRWIMVVAGAAAFLTLPTNYRYGFTGFMVPLLWLWMVVYVVSLVREGRLRSGAEVAGTIGVGLAIFGLTQLFAGVDANNFLFRGFVPVIDFGRYGFEALVGFGLVAKVIVFFPKWPRRWLPALVATVIIGGLQHLHWRTWEPGPWDGLLIAAGLLAGWLGLRQRDPELAQVFLLGLLFYLYAYFVRPYRESYDRATCVLAALVLAARWMRRFAQPMNARMDYAVFGVVALLATGYFTASWSIEQLEWSRIYYWVPAHVAETAAVAAVLVPWIILKTALPLFIARVVLARELEAYVKWPTEELRRLAGFKILTTLLVLTGLGLGGTLNTVYLEGVQQLMVLAILAVGLLFGSREKSSVAA